MAGRTWPFGVICALLTALPCAGRAGEPDADGHAMNAGHGAVLGCGQVLLTQRAQREPSTQRTTNGRHQLRTASDQ